MFNRPFLAHDLIRKVCNPRLRGGKLFRDHALLSGRRPPWAMPEPDGLEFREFGEHHSPRCRFRFVWRGSPVSAGQLLGATDPAAVAAAIVLGLLRRRGSGYGRPAGVAKGGTAHLLEVKRLNKLGRTMPGRHCSYAATVTPRAGRSQEGSLILPTGYVLSWRQDRRRRCGSAVTRRLSAAASTGL